MPVRHCINSVPISKYYYNISTFQFVSGRAFRVYLKKNITTEIPIIIYNAANTVADYFFFRFGRAAAVGRRRFAHGNHVAWREHRLPDRNVLPPDAVFQGQELSGSGQASQDVSHVQKASGKRTRQVAQAE